MVNIFVFIKMILIEFFSATWIPWTSKKETGTWTSTIAYLPFCGFRQLQRHMAAGELVVSFWPKLGIHCHWAVRVLWCTTPTVTNVSITEHRIIMVISEDLRHTAIEERLAVELSLPIFTSKVYLGWDSNTKPCSVSALTHFATTTALSVRTLVSKLSNSIK